MSIQTIIVRDRIFKQCPECKRYVGYVRCRYCGKKYKTPHSLFWHEEHCYVNPNGICSNCGETWDNCICEDGVRQQEFMEKWTESHKPLDPPDPEIEAIGQAFLRRVQAEIAATTVQPEKAVEA